MPTEIQAIDFGVKFVEASFALRIDSTLDCATKEQLKRLLTTYFSAFGMTDLETDLEMIISLPESYEVFLKLAEILLSVERRIDAAHDPTLHLGSYFFVSSAITLVDISFLSLVQQGFDRNALESVYPFLERAMELSSSAGIVPPNITRTVYLHDDIESVQACFKKWMLSLRTYACRSSTRQKKSRLVLRGVLKGIPYFGPAIEALIFGKD